MINLIKYAIFIALLFTGQLGWLFILAGIAALMGSKHGFNIMYSLDVLAASFIHKTRYRTISGITGERALMKIRRYQYQEKFIDRLAMLFGDRPNHCRRAFEWELNHLSEFNQ